MKGTMKRYRKIVIGCSTGGLKALSIVLSALDRDFSLPIAVVQHLGSESTGILADLLRQKTWIPVKEVDDKESICRGTIYVAPAGYHLLIENDAMFSLSVDEKENYARPSIDALFESASDAYGSGLIGVILTGSNADGSLGISTIRDRGGLTVVQEPESAEASEMPRAALKAIEPDQILPLEEIGPFLNALSKITKETKT
jgi:two-component system chemotaxis response regulator CheB